MSEMPGFQAITIGEDSGTIEMTLDKKAIDDWATLVQWPVRELVEKLHLAPPGDKH